MNVSGAVGSGQSMFARRQALEIHQGSLCLASHQWTVVIVGILPFHLHLIYHSQCVGWDLNVGESGELTETIINYRYHKTQTHTFTAPVGVDSGLELWVFYSIYFPSSIFPISMFMLMAHTRSLSTFNLPPHPPTDYSSLFIFNVYSLWLEFRSLLQFHSNHSERDELFVFPLGTLTNISSKNYDFLGSHWPLRRRKNYEDGGDWKLTNFIQWWSLGSYLNGDNFLF